MTSRCLASDLDGTLIPPDWSPDRRRDIDTFSGEVARAGIALAYITGRHLALALDGIRSAGLPWPTWLFCDVGTSLHVGGGGSYTIDAGFRRAMTDALGPASFDEVRGRLAGLAGVELQAPARQAEFKLSYDVRGRPIADASSVVRGRLASMAGRFRVVASEDPVTAGGLIDVLPAASGKRFALEWVCRVAGLETADVIYAGDSGNDHDALLSGHPAVLVGNAPESLRRALGLEAAEAGIAERLYCASQPFAAGVLEGCRHFEFI